MLKSSILIILGFFATCAGNSDSFDLGRAGSHDKSMQVEPTESSTMDSDNSEGYTLEKGSKIIKNGSMRFEVSNLEDVKSSIDALVKTAKGYYEKENYNAYGDRISYSLLIRVPNTEFDAFIQSLEVGVGDLKDKSINANDVTEEYVDLNIRLESNLAYLKQYKTILSKAKTVKEILEIQEKIRRIEEEIESKKGRLKYLDDKVSFSTLNLTISELVESTVSNQPSFFVRLANAFKSGIGGFLNFVIGMIYIWPFWLLLFILFLLRKRILRLIKGK